MPWLESSVWGLLDELYKSLCGSALFDINRKRNFWRVYFPFFHRFHLSSHHLNSIPTLVLLYPTFPCGFLEFHILRYYFTLMVIQLVWIQIFFEVLALPRSSHKFHLRWSLIFLFVPWSWVELTAKLVQVTLKKQVSIKRNICVASLVLGRPCHASRAISLDVMYFFSASSIMLKWGLDQKNFRYSFS